MERFDYCTLASGKLSAAVVSVGLNVKRLAGSDRVDVEELKVLFVKVALCHSSSGTTTSESRQEPRRDVWGRMEPASGPQLLCPDTISDFL